jgi:hypothetical protein
MGLLRSLRLLDESPTGAACSDLDPVFDAEIQKVLEEAMPNVIPDSGTGPAEMIDQVQDRLARAKAIVIAAIGPEPVMPDLQTIPVTCEPTIDPATGIKTGGEQMWKGDPNGDNIAKMFISAHADWTVLVNSTFQALTLKETK